MSCNAFLNSLRNQEKPTKLVVMQNFVADQTIFVPKFLHVYNIARWFTFQPVIQQNRVSRKWLLAKYLIDPNYS